MLLLVPSWLLLLQTPVRFAAQLPNGPAHHDMTGGIGVIGGIRLTPKMLQKTIDEIKEHLEDKNAPYGIDLLIPQVGGSARKTNVSLPLRSCQRKC